MDKGNYPILSVCRLSAIAEADCGKTHGSLCPKGAVALWAAVDSFFLEKLLHSLHGCPRLKGRRPNGPEDYIICKAECETRPYFRDLVRNDLFASLSTLSHQRYARRLRVAYHFILFALTRGMNII